ncbi:MAG: hypothetical protein QOF69_1574 [Solirubrobacteraceae bacterium]|nr:hypothetical protein [Solirubrobacteraceae bacterium]
MLGRPYRSHLLSRRGSEGRILAPRHGGLRLLATWCVDAPIQRVWDVIYASERYPEHARVRPARHALRTTPPARVPGHRRARGLGAWRLFSSPLGTAILLSWDVATTRAWMNRMRRLARPAFACNHDLVMRPGADGLAKQLDATPIAFDEYSGHRDRDDRDHGSEIPTTVSGP